MLDGTKRKLLNVSLMKKYNFRPLINIKAGFKKILKKKIFSMPYI